MATKDILVSMGEDRKEAVTAFLADIASELDDHLFSINENTDEINQNFAYIEMINQKIDKISQRVDEVCLFLKNMDRPFQEEKTFAISPLTKKEKAIFSALYSRLAEGKDVAYADLSRELCLPESLVSGYVTHMIEKGIPVLKKRTAKCVLLSLDKAFMEKQAKENIVGVNTLLTHWIR